MKLMTLPRLLLVTGVTLQSSLTLEETEPFVPFETRAHRLVNSIAFSPDDEVMYCALFHREFLVQRGTPDAGASEIALFSARRDGEDWGELQLLEFSGTFEDYEPTLSRDGKLMVFNSKRPYPDGRTPEVNDLWMVERDAEGWGEPSRIEPITSFEHEESYATLSDDRTLVFVKGRTGPDGEATFDLYESRFEDGAFATPTRHPVSSDANGEGDPWISAAGDVLIFTRWDDELGWQRSVDLYISFREQGDWTTPVPLEGLNTAGADYAPAASSAGDVFYYRADSRFRRLPLEWVLDEYRPD